MIMIRTIFAVAALMIALAFGSPAQNNSDLVGTWKLVSGTAHTGDSGKAPICMAGIRPALSPTHPDGRMSLIISSDGRKPLSLADRVAAPETKGQRRSPLVWPMRDATRSQAAS